MVDNSEEVLVEPVSTAIISDSSLSDELKPITTLYDSKVLNAVNSRPSPIKNTNVYPILPEHIVAGYVNGIEKNITVVNLDGFLITKITALDFINMQKAAAVDRIKIGIISAWRSYEQQAVLRKDRHNIDGSLTESGKLRGRAAPAGYSNHQQGNTLDIETNMTVADLAAGRFSANYLWLTAHASEFGFERTVSSEPWHWEHKLDTLSSTPVSTEVINLFEDTTNLSSNALSSNQTGAGLYLARNNYDLAKAYNRSSQMSTSSRNLFFISHAEESIFKGATSNNYIAQVVQAKNSLVTKPIGFIDGDDTPLTYDFTTGLWGDGKPV